MKYIALFFTLALASQLHADDVLARLRARLPRSKHYALGAEPGHAVLVEPWRVLLPAQAVDAAFEGV